MTRPALLLLALAACFAALASALLPAEGSARPAPAAVGHLAPSATHVHGGTAVSSTLDELSADDAFFADLFDGAATDLSPEQAAWMLSTAHRMCDLGQPRAEWVASLTASGPYVLTVDEAGKLFDVAHGALCPPASVTVAPAAVVWTSGQPKTYRPAPVRPARRSGAWHWLSA